MKKLAVALALVCALLAGCGAVEADATQEVQTRFSVIPEESGYVNKSLFIVVDNETGVMYLAYQYYKGAGITVMLDADGKPLIWEDAE